MPNPEDLLTSADVALQLDRHVRTVHRMVEAGRLQAQRVPGYRGPLLFDPAEVERVRVELATESPPGRPSAA